MTREEIYLAAHDHLVQVPHLGGSRIVYEFLPQELLDFVTKLMIVEAE